MSLTADMVLLLLCIKPYSHPLWLQDEGDFPHGSLGNDRHGWAVEFANTAMEFLTHLQQYMMTSGTAWLHNYVALCQTIECFALAPKGVNVRILPQWIGLV
eukprot:GHRR01032211.1.p3 GENE.GHRR01032211.1~~GHRR01032211.1.p3  ORF type:complete len:101 (+),score=19.89 GHRR01032211.1:611-913(+)